MLVSWNLYVAAGFISLQDQLPALFCNRAASGCSSPPQIPRLVSSPTKTGGFLRAKLNFDKLRNKDIFLPHSVRRFVGSSRTSAWDGEWIGRDTKAAVSIIFLPDSYLSFISSLDGFRLAECSVYTPAVCGQWRYDADDYFPLITAICFECIWA